MVALETLLLGGAIGVDKEIIEPTSGVLVGDVAITVVALSVAEITRALEDLTVAELGLLEGIIELVPDIAAVDDTAEDEGFVEGGLEGDVNGVVEIAAEDAVRDTGAVAKVVVGVLLNAVLGDLVISAAGIVVSGALEPALVVGWLVASVPAVGGGLAVGVVSEA